MYLARRNLTPLAQQQLTLSARRLTGDGTQRTGIWDAHAAIVHAACAISGMAARTRTAADGSYYARHGYEYYGRAAAARELTQGEDRDSGTPGFQEES